MQAKREEQRSCKIVASSQSAISSQQLLGTSGRALQVFVEKGDHALDRVDLVFALGEAVAFRGIVVEFHGLTRVLKDS